MGAKHTVLLRNDGQAIAFGDNGHGQCDVPELPEGVRYTAAVAGPEHTVLIRDDGQAVAFGKNEHGMCSVPRLPDGCRYVAAAAGNEHTVLLRDDGRAVVFGQPWDGRCEVPDLPDGCKYIAAAAGNERTVLLVDNGEVRAFGKDDERCAVPPAPPGTRYISVAACFNQTMLLRDDGCVVSLLAGGIEVPILPEGRRFEAVSVSTDHAVFLLDDGTARCAGHAADGRSCVPVLPDGRRYLAAAALRERSVLIRDDGTAVAIGKNENGRCDVPALPEGRRYISAASSAHSTRCPDVVSALYKECSVTLRVARTQVFCTNLAGEEVARVRPAPGEQAKQLCVGRIRAAVAEALGARPLAFHFLVFSSGRALTGSDAQTLEDIFEPKTRAGMQWTARALGGAAAQEADSIDVAPAREALLRILGESGVDTVPEHAIRELLRWKLNDAVPASPFDGP